MKTLILVRHAKSSWEYNVIDHERPLKERGVNDAIMVSNHLKIDTSAIDLILCSDAVRTKATSEIFISELNLKDKQIEYLHDLYDFDGQYLIEVIKGCDKAIDTLMVFGHNHGLTWFANTYGNTFIDNVPTSGVVVIEFPITDWKDLNKGETSLTLFPRDLKKK
ncbi:SixA phosphatase family protein [Tamlana flava]|uniref:SixA phosphatase family protein n=1 Tax=Tamlana flava TaxID=3158572 RepID=UPI00351AC48D